MSMRLLLADDHSLFRDGLRTLLADKRDIEVVGEAATGLEAVRLASELSPDLIIMDISMPGLNGIEATRRIVADNPDVRVAVLSMHAGRRYAVEALRAGARAYILKDSAVDEVLAMIRRVMAGNVFLSRTITDLIITDYLAQDPSEDDSAYNVLSAREREVLQQVAEGCSTKAIASNLNVSVKTIETHRRQIMEKLDLHSVAELTKYAICEGLTQLD